MALQYYYSIKNRARTPSAAFLQGLSSSLLPLHSARKASNIYDIEVIKEDGPRVLVHYIGYSSEYDEWKSKEEVLLKKPVVMTGDFDPITELSCSIKRKLLPSRPEDPQVKIKLPTTQEAFNSLCSFGHPDKHAKTYGIPSYECLEHLLGRKWYMRIANRNGDFSYAVLPTVKFYLVRQET